MNIAVTGPNGYIGKTLVSNGCLPLLMDVTNPEEVEREIKEKKPDLILHLASKSDPDWCEKPENESCAIQTNVRGAWNVIGIASRYKIPVVLFSSSYIWKGGFWERPHRENDKPNAPVNLYGMTKMGAESVAKMFGTKIIRSSCLFSLERLAKKIERLRSGEVVCEPTFIRRSFIHREHFAGLVLRYCDRFDEMPQVLHLAGSETVSYYDFVWEVANRYKLDSGLVKARRFEENGHAPRPHNAGLNTNLARSLGFRLPSFEEGIDRMKHEV